MAYASAKLAVSNFSAEQVQELAHALMDEGYYDDELLAIIDAKPPTLRDIAKPFGRLLAKFGVDFASEEQAVRWLIDRHTNRILEDPTHAFDIVGILFDDICTARDIDAAKLGIVRLLDLESLYRDWSEGRSDTDARAQKAIAGFRREIIDEAARWQERFGAASGAPGHSKD